MNTNKTTKVIARVGILLALTCVIAPLSILTQPVPFTMQMLMLFLVAMLLPFSEATTVISLYVFLGAIGLPVFAGYVGGLSKIVGVTGGYIVAFPFIPLFFWLFEKKGFSKLLGRSLAVFTSFTFVCTAGMIWMYIWGTKIQQPSLASFASFKYLLMIGYLPFLPFNMAASGAIASWISDRAKDAGAV